VYTATETTVSIATYCNEHALYYIRSTRTWMWSLSTVLLQVLTTHMPQTRCSTV